MNNEIWYTSLPLSPAISESVPLGLQPGLPMPFFEQDRLLIYVPFYRARAHADAISYSDILLEICFEAVTKRIALRREPGSCQDASWACTHDMKPLSGDALQERTYLYQDLLHQLDKIENEYRHTQGVSANRMKKYFEQLMEGLPCPAHRRQYEQACAL